MKTRIFKSKHKKDKVQPNEPAVNVKPVTSTPVIANANQPINNNAEKELNELKTILDTVTEDFKSIGVDVSDKTESMIQTLEKFEVVRSKVRSVIQSRLSLLDANDNQTKEINEIFVKFDSNTTSDNIKLSNAFKPVSLTVHSILELRTANYLMKLLEFIKGKSEADLANSQNFDIFSSMVNIMLNEKLQKENKLIELYRRQFQEFTSQFNMTDQISSIESLSQSLQKIPVSQDKARNEILYLLNIGINACLSGTRTEKKFIDHFTPEGFEKNFNYCKDQTIPFVLLMNKFKQNKGREQFGLNATVPQKNPAVNSDNLQAHGTSITVRFGQGK